MIKKKNCWLVCLVATTVQFLDSMWEISFLRSILTGTKLLHEISQKVLTSSLKAIVTDGITI